jgi:putative transposase
MPAASRAHRRNFNLTGQAHALTFSCYKRYAFLKADRTCQWLATAIETARSDLDFAVWAFVFMPEHAHLLIHSRNSIYDIANIRKAIKKPVGQSAICYLQSEAPLWIPRITRRRGTKTERLFWQSGGGYDRNIDNQKTLSLEIDYIHLNPVRRELVDAAAAWKWSSAGWFVGTPTCSLIPDRIPPEWLDLN